MLNIIQLKGDATHMKYALECISHACCIMAQLFSFNYRDKSVYTIHVYYLFNGIYNYLKWRPTILHVWVGGGEREWICNKIIKEACQTGSLSNLLKRICIIIHNWLC